MRKLLIGALALLTFATAAEATSGEAACQDVEKALVIYGVLSSCEYVPISGSPGEFMYKVTVIDTNQTGAYTVGFIAASIMGVDRHVPTRSIGIGIVGSGQSFVFEMAQVRVCRDQFISKDDMFVYCLAKIGSVVP